MMIAAEELLRWNNERWREARLAVIPAEFARVVRKLTPAVEQEEGCRGANGFVGEAARELSDGYIKHAFNEDAILAHAENFASLCARMRSLESRQSFALCIGIKPPAGKTITPAGAAARLDNPVWWRDQLRKHWTRKAENKLVRLGVVRKNREPYASNEAVGRRRAQKRKMAEFLERHELVNEQGEQLSLLEVAERSLANPRIRRGEFMKRLAGFDAIAAELGHECDFWTLTAPSAFHAQLHKGGKNPRYQGETVRAAQRWISKMWARVRAFLDRKSVYIYGFRTAEPHHDGTPHWHVLVFGKPAALDFVRECMTRIFLSEYGDEPNARAVRTKVKRINPAIGSAVGYLAKYVAKNIDGHGEIGDALSDETGRPIREEVIRVDAWASTHGIRQFAQFGGPPVGRYREVRRLREPQEDPDIERIRLAADDPDFRVFIHALSSDHIYAGRNVPLKLNKEETGELNKYGECRPARIVGVRYASAVAITRPNRWRIERKGLHQKEGRCDSGTAMLRGRPGAGEASHASKKGASGSPSAFFSALGPVAITVRDDADGGSPAGWSNPQETSQAPPQ